MKKEEPRQQAEDYNILYNMSTIDLYSHIHKTV